jgi:S-formylglutathione hydrolase FrmB
VRQAPRCALLCMAGIVGCSKPPSVPDRPQLTPLVRMVDVTLHSDALKRDMKFRLIVPAASSRNARLPVVYLLHGAGQDFRDWSNHSNIASFAAQNVVLVMPDESGSYYINEAHGSNRRYEDYFINEVMPEVQRAVPYAAVDRNDTAIVGISRGGYGAAVLALHHPQSFGFVGDLSGAMDFPERRFRYRAPLDSLALRKVFGAGASATRPANDPFVLLSRLAPSSAPFFFITCGDKDSLLATNKRFAAVLQGRGIPYEFHELPGGHNWEVWGTELPMLEAALLAHLGTHPAAGAP